MNKTLTVILAVVAVVAIVMCFVINGNKADLQKQVDSLTAEVAAAKADAEKQVADAKAEAEQQVADAKADAEKQVADKEAELQAQADAAMAEVQQKVAEAQDQMNAQVQEKLNEAMAEVQKQYDAAIAEEQEKAAAEKAELEKQIADLTEQLNNAAVPAVEGISEEEMAEAEQALEELGAVLSEAEAAAAEEGAEAAEAVETAMAEAAETVEAAAAAAEDEVKVMTHEEYVAAENDTEVLIESYVQNHQSWWDNKVTVYLQSEDGAYFAYELACSEEDAAKLVPGQKIRIKGYKSEWAGEVEIVDGAFEFVDAEPWIAEATDVTALLATDELINHMNEFVAVKGAVIAAQDDGAAFAYKNAEEKTDDLYFRVEVDGKVYDFCVEFYLTGADTDVYKAVEGLNVGDTVDLEGFLYWYNGANLQATGLTVK